MPITEPELYPFRPGDWVADYGDRVGKVRSVNWCSFDHEVILDIVIYSYRGDKVGRESPACGGPRTFEPACSASGWRRIAQPSFPMRIQWVGQEDGTMVSRYYAGETLPPANWKKPRRKARLPKVFNNQFTRDELTKIADHFAGANDPVSQSILAKATRHV